MSSLAVSLWRGQTTHGPARAETSNLGQPAKPPVNEKPAQATADKQPAAPARWFRRLTVRGIGVVTGTLVEQSPNHSVTLLLSTKEVLTIRWDDIEKQEDITEADIATPTFERRPNPPKSAVGAETPRAQLGDTESPNPSLRPSTAWPPAKYIKYLGAGFLYSYALSTSFYLGSLEVRTGLLLPSRIELTFGPRISFGQTANGNTLTIITPLTFAVGRRWFKWFYAGVMLQFAELLLIQVPNDGFL